MKILWITNQPTPDIAKASKLKTGFGGGWMNLLRQQLSKKNDLIIAFPTIPRQTYIGDRAGNVRYFAIPTKKMKLKPHMATIEYFRQTIEAVQPDVIHIWGTEYVHTYEAVVAAKECGMIDKTVISIQGLVSVYAQHFYCGLSKSNFCRLTLRDIVRKTGINRQKKNFVKRGKFEQAALCQVHHVIGRTDWDKACTFQLNPSQRYHHCNETLREPFYLKNWDIANCQKHSVFVSQSQYPIKGFHKALEALAILRKKYPDIHLYTTGKNRLSADFKERLKMGNYDVLVRNQIKKLGLEQNVSFLGVLNEEEMRDRFLKSHIFLSPSSIENSPNSVGEAMLLGMPVVSSDVGGVKNMLTHEKEGYVYQADAAYMMAYYIDKIFSDDELAVRLGENAHKHAMMTHDREKNFRTLMDIYKTISFQEKET